MKDKGISIEEARAKNSSWAITYADLVTLLLTFFILLLVILNEEEKQIDRIINMLMNETYSELKKVESQYLKVTRETKGVKLTVSSGRLFKSMEAEVQASALPLLDQIGAIVRVSKLLRLDEDQKYNNFRERIRSFGKDLNVEIRCEGHTDGEQVPPNSKYDSNWDLSTARALNIVKYISNKSQIPEKEFSAMGYGEFRPVVAMDTVSQNLLAIKDANSKNRRVEIYLDAFLKTNVITQ
jgi:chemotaxis protein MotB|tara:strand:- start:272 stop:988 length:717 start_codon:yes stop_codon:yes gene_type:complete